jgi:hypothetical protein
MADRARHESDPLLQHDGDIGPGQEFGRPQFGDEDRSADRRVTGKGKFARRCEYPQPCGIDGIVRLQHENRLGQVEFARDRLHASAIEPVAIEHDGQRIAGERVLGEDIERMKFPPQARPFERVPATGRVCPSAAIAGQVTYGPRDRRSFTS